MHGLVEAFEAVLSNNFSENYLTLSSLFLLTSLKTVVSKISFGFTRLPNFFLNQNFNNTTIQQYTRNCRKHADHIANTQNTMHKPHITQLQRTCNTQRMSETHRIRFNGRSSSSTVISRQHELHARVI